MNKNVENVQREAFYETKEINNETEETIKKTNEINNETEETIKETNEINKETFRESNHGAGVGAQAFVIFIVRKRWMPCYLPNCEEWVTITHSVDTPCILGIYFNQNSVNRMIEILDRSLSLETRKIVDLYCQEISSTELMNLINLHSKSILKLRRHNYLTNITYDHIYCNGQWIDAYNLITRIERYQQKKCVSSNKRSFSDYNQDVNNNNILEDTNVNNIPHKLFDKNSSNNSITKSSDNSITKSSDNSITKSSDNSITKSSDCIMNLSSLNITKSDYVYQDSGDDECISINYFV